MTGKPQVVRISTSQVDEQRIIRSPVVPRNDTDPEQGVPDQPIQRPTIPLGRPTIPLFTRDDLRSIDLSGYSETGLQVDITGQAVEEITLADIGHLMQDAASSNVDLDVEWVIPESSDEPWRAE